MEPERFTGDSVFLIEVSKIRPNPYQPRKEFNEDRLRDLADSIRMYGVLQPLVVTRHEVETPDGGLATEYELIAGERRWRASQLAGLYQVPAVIRSGEQTDKLKLEIAIIENLQREDLNAVDRAQAFHQLANEFGLKHVDIAKRIGKSREYVSNSIRIMALPQEVLDAIVAGKITEGHTKPILMLADRPEEQLTLFQEIMLKRLTVREAESIARRIAFDRVRKKHLLVAPAIVEMEEKLTEKFGTRVKVEQKEQGGRVTIDYFSPEDLNKILGLLDAERAVAEVLTAEALLPETSDLVGNSIDDTLPEDNSLSANPDTGDNNDDELYLVRNFTV
ncbi:MAG: ParB/RepB/Spo0J family partition protein [bacterium]